MLAIADRFEPAVLRSLEARYEDRSKDFRFENSDLFGLGPLVAYLREHPRGDRPRVLFLGNSITYGYTLSAADALPAQYQRLDTSAKVFNVGINGFRTASSLLIAKASIDAVDAAYVLSGPPEHGPRAAPILPSLIPVDAADLAHYNLAAPNQTERLLARAAGHWRLYRDAYRLQAAMFGASTRQYIYLHKGALARGLIARAHAEQGQRPASGESVSIAAPLSNALPDASRLSQLRTEAPELWQFGDVFRDRRKQLTVLYLPGYSEELTDGAIADFNVVFAPYARILVLGIPAQLKFDEMHLTAAGGAAVARALWDARPEGQRR